MTAGVVRGDQCGVAHCGILQARELGHIVQGHAGQAHADQREKALPGRQNAAFAVPKHNRKQRRADQRITDTGQRDRRDFPHGQFDKQGLHAPDGRSQSQQAVKLPQCLTPHAASPSRLIPRGITPRYGATGCNGRNFFENEFQFY